MRFRCKASVPLRLVGHVIARHRFGCVLAHARAAQRLRGQFERIALPELRYGVSGNAARRIIDF